MPSEMRDSRLSKWPIPAAARSLVWVGSESSGVKLSSPKILKPITCAIQMLRFSPSRSPETFMSVTIRSAVLDDVPPLLAIEQEAASAAHWTREQYERLVESGIVLVAEEEGTISGFVCAKHVVGAWEIENMVVAKHVRRRRIGNGLAKELLPRP